jgi:predicted transcriptional regulator
MDRDRLLELTAQIVSSHVGGNTVEPDALPSLITQVFQTLCSIGTGEVEAVKAEPAVPIKRSVFGAHLVCLECGKSFKMLKRHLSTDHSLTPEGYRTKWGLPTSYPLVAPNYAKIRSALAVSIGLGRTRQGVAGSPPPAVQVTKLPEARRGRRKMA